MQLLLGKLGCQNINGFNAGGLSQQFRRMLHQSRLSWLLFTSQNLVTLSTAFRIRKVASSGKLGCNGYFGYPDLSK
jgi:hypothetical protein